jgi:Tfx family DNA-binding protein
MRRRYGLLTEAQVEIIRLRLAGLTQEEVAKRRGTTHQDVAAIEKRARRNLKLAEETIGTYEKLTSATSIEIEPGTHLVDVPRQVLNAADRANIRLKADFTRIYNEIKYKAAGSVEGTRVVKPITVHIQKDGDIEIARTV